MPASLGYLFFSTLLSILVGTRLIEIESKYLEIIMVLYTIIIVGIPMVIDI